MILLNEVPIVAKKVVRWILGKKVVKVVLPQDKVGGGAWFC